MGWHQDEIGAMAFFSPGTDLKALVEKIATHNAKRRYPDNDVQVYECVVFLGRDDIVCRLHAPRKDRPGEKGGAERIADWVNSVLNDGELGPHIKESHTYVVGYEVPGVGAKAD